MGRMAEGRWRLTAHAAAALLIVAALTACTPDPTPTPSPTGFASDEEAFAAAEDTTRAYVAATNAIQLADPSTFEPLFELTTGEQNAFDRKRLSEYHAAGYTMSGVTTINALEPEAWDEASASVTLLACFDVSGLEIEDNSGSSIIAPDRPPEQSLMISLVRVGADLLIDSIAGAEESNVCA